MNTPPIFARMLHDAIGVQTKMLEHEPAQPTERELKITDYCQAYSTLSFATLASAFNLEKHSFTSFSNSGGTSPRRMKSDEMTVESEVSKLISKGLLPNHRINAVDEGVISIEPEAWQRIGGDALAAAAEVEHAMRLKLHQVNVVLAGMEVKRGAAGFGVWVW